MWSPSLHCNMGLHTTFLTFYLNKCFNILFSSYRISKQYTKPGGEIVNNFHNKKILNKPSFLVRVKYQSGHSVKAKYNFIHQSQRGIICH